MKFAHKFFYFATDWHDWCEGDSFLNDIRPVTDMSDEEIAGLFADSICESFDLDRNTIFNALKARMAFRKEHNAYEETTLQYMSDGRIVVEYGCQATWKEWYEIIEIPDANVRYVPIINFQCFPRCAPCVDRFFTLQLFDTPEKAETFNEALLKEHGVELGKGHCAEIVPHVVVVDKDKFPTSLWYKKNADALADPDFWKNFYPIIPTREEDKARAKAEAASRVNPTIVKRPWYVEKFTLPKRDDNTGSNEPSVTTNAE